MTDSINESTFDWTISVAVIASALAVFVIVIGFAWMFQLPTIEDVSALSAAQELLAYNTAGNDPRLLTGNNSSVSYSHLASERQSVMSGLRPVWALSEPWYVFPRTAQPASVYALMCPGDSAVACDYSVELVGELRNPKFAFIDVAVDGGWERHYVWGGGFIIPIGRDHLVGDVRFLSEDNAVIWSIDRDQDVQIEPRVPGDLSPVAVRRLQAR